MSGKGGGLQGFIDEGRARLGGGKPLSEILSQVRDNPAGFLPPPTQDAARAVGSLFGRPYEETPIGMFSSMRGKPIEEQLKVSESDPAWGFAGTTIGKGIRAFHGSPHSFDRFDLGKIGTGEGAQAYGHGLYFAENEGVARSYRDALADRSVNVDGTALFADMPWMRNEAKQVAGAALQRAMGRGLSGDDAVKAAMENLTEQAKLSKGPSNAQVFYDANNALPGLIGKNWDVGNGHMYEVNINASPDEFLDWDKPLNQQSQRVQGILAEGGIKYDATANQRFDDALLDALQSDGPMTTKLPPQPPSMLGSDIYSSLSYRAKPVGYDENGRAMFDAMTALAGRNPVSASETLAGKGIPGIKYLDQGSRAAGDGSRNYVVFNPSLIEIMRKYGILAPVATFGAMAYGDNESANNGNR